MLSELALGVMPEMPACPSPNGGRNILIVSPFKEKEDNLLHKEAVL
ncbi:hypothetical protein [Bartonella quintana]|nr:hypothetical protein [Bartonella quintana]